MSAQMSDQRIIELLRLRNKIDAELARLAVVTGATTGRHRSRHDIPDCGTESAFQRHRYRGEPQDDACRAAHNEHNRNQYEAKKARQLAELLAQVRRAA